ncbi:MAG: PepSY domain-containing protein [Oscillospiraceae bacterium]|nr:PepSY domain-containing protein [Oscillospiraceae bacterium]
MTNNNDLERKIGRAFKNATPNVLDAVLRDCENMKGQRIMMIERKTNWVKRAVAVAAVIVLVFGLSAGLITVGSNNSVASVISLDVNPSIEIKVNKNERVLEVVPLNDDGTNVIGDMDFKGSDIDVVINALIGSMLREGYLNDLANSILISVDGDDSAKNAELQARLASEIDNLLNTDHFTGSVLSQTVNHDTELDALAQQYGITAGKAQLIRQITNQNTHYTFEDLAKLTINELNLLNNGNTLDNVTSTGTASDKKYIGAEAAKIAAVKHSGYFDSIGDVDTMTREELLSWIDVYVKKLECELDYEKGNMVYEIEFDIGYYDYEYEVDAKTGEILTHSKEFDGENVSPEFDGIEFNFELEGEHNGAIDGVIAQSDSKYNDEYVFAAEFVKEFDTFIFSTNPQNRFSEYIKDEELLEYTTVLAEGFNISNRANPCHGVKIAYALVEDEDKTYVIDEEHTVVYVAERATLQYEGAQASSGYGKGWSVIVKRIGDGKYEITDWYMGKDGYDMSSRGVNAEFGDVQFWNNSEKYTAVLSGAHAHYEYITSLYSGTPNVSSSDESTYAVTREEAIAIALEHAGVKESEVHELECERDVEHGITVFEVEFESGSYDYNYEINVETGAVVKHSKKLDDDNAWDSIENALDANSGNQSASSNFIGNDAAKAAALEHAGVSAADATGLECELDRAEGIFEKDHYDVEFSAGGYDYEYEIHAETGKVLKSEKERDD